MGFVGDDPGVRSKVEDVVGCCIGDVVGSGDGLVEGSQSDRLWVNLYSKLMDMM
jgi:hypothetical protein